MKRTFVDTNVLFAAARGNDNIHIAAMAILDDPDREFVASDFLRLEVLPKPVFFDKKPEIEFYESFFRGVKQWANTDNNLLESAFKEACACGMSAIDSLHVTAAAILKADELITGEKSSRPLHKNTLGVKTVSLNP